MIDFMVALVLVSLSWLREGLPNKKNKAGDWSNRQIYNGYKVVKDD